MTIRVVGVAALLFFAIRLTKMSVIGSGIIPCDGSLVVYCWTQDVLGSGLAWVFWHGLFSLAAGWAIVALSTERATS